MKILKRLSCLLLLLVLPLSLHGDVVTSVPSPLSGGGAFSGGDVTGQTNVCGPDNATNVEIGSCTSDANAGTGGTSVVIGNGATNTINGTGVVIIGSLAAVTTTSGVDSIAIGRAATVTSSNGMVIGAGASAANGAIKVGNGGSAAADSIAIGLSAIAVTSEFVASSAASISNVYFGKGKNSTTATDWTANGTGGLGADNAGASAFLAAGRATGTGKGGQSGLLRSLRAATSSTPQALAPAVIVCPSITLSNTSATAQTIATITTTNATAGAISWFYAVTASNGTAVNVDAGTINVGWNNNAGTAAATAGTAVSTANSVGAGTLVAVPTATVATNVVSLRVTPTWVTIVPTSVVGYAVFQMATSGDTVVCQ